jgi:hypothetical protein
MTRSCEVSEQVPTYLDWCVNIQIQLNASLQTPADENVSAIDPPTSPFQYIAYTPLEGCVIAGTKLGEIAIMCVRSKSCAPHPQFQWSACP